MNQSPETWQKTRKTEDRRQKNKDTRHQQNTRTSQTWHSKTKPETRSDIRCSGWVSISCFVYGTWHTANESIQGGVKASNQYRINHSNTIRKKIQFISHRKLISFTIVKYSQNKSCRSHLKSFSNLRHLLLINKITFPRISRACIV